MSYSGMGPYSMALAALAKRIKEEDARKLEEKNGVNVCGPPNSRHLEYTYPNIVSVSGPPASPNSQHSVYMQPVLHAPEMINSHTATASESPPSAYTVVTYEPRKITLISPNSPEESDSDRESSSESSDSSDSELMTTPVKRTASNYMMVPYIATPTTSHKRIRRRHLNCRNPNLLFDLEDISEDEGGSGEPLAQKRKMNEDVLNNESPGTGIYAVAHICNSRNE